MVTAKIFVPFDFVVTEKYFCTFIYDKLFISTGVEILFKTLLLNRLCIKQPILILYSMSSGEPIRRATLLLLYL